MADSAGIDRPNRARGWSARPLLRSGAKEAPMTPVLPMLLLLGLGLLVMALLFAFVFACERV